MDVIVANLSGGKNGTITELSRMTIGISMLYWDKITLSAALLEAKILHGTYSKNPAGQLPKTQSRLCMAFLNRWCGLSQTILGVVHGGAALLKYLSGQMVCLWCATIALGTSPSNQNSFQCNIEWSELNLQQ